MTHQQLRSWCRIACGLALVLVFDASRAAAQPIATVTVPAAVSFPVTNISVPTQGAPGNVTVSFANASGLTSSQRVTISVKADTTTFAAPAGGTGIPASAVSWAVTGTQRGTGTNGTLSALAYSQIFRAVNNQGSGSVTLNWQLSPLTANGLRAGAHTMTVRWRFEAL